MIKPIFKTPIIITTLSLFPIVIVSTTISCNHQVNLNQTPISFEQEWNRILNIQSKIAFNNPKLNLQTLWNLHHQPNLIWDYLNQDFRNNCNRFQYHFYKIEFPFVNEMQAFFKLVDNFTNQSQTIIFNLSFITIHSWN